MDGIVLLVFCVLAIPVAVGFGIGWALRGRQPAGSRTPGVTTTSREHAVQPEASDHVSWLLGELDKAPFRDALGDDVRLAIARHYRPAPPALRAAPEAAAVAGDQLAIDSVPPPVVTTPTSPQAGARVYVGDPEPATGFTASPLAAETPPERARAEWDPAVLMLYLGAFLVAAAGLVYSSYNWADLGSWQKLGMLAAATIAFAGTGLALLANERVREAAETFVAIGALLVPANAVAAYTVFEETDARTALIVLLGSLTTALVYGVFSLRPGGIIYSYGTVIAGSLSIAALLPAFGASVGWGAVLLILAIALAPDIGGRLQDPLRHMGYVELPVATLVGLLSIFDTSDWIIPATLAATTLALARFAARSGNPAPAALCTLTGIGTVAGVLFALNVESPGVWALTAIATSFALIFIGERGPAWLCSGWALTVLHAEAIVGFSYAVLAVSDSPAWRLSAALAVGIAGTALIAWLRDARWWLVITGMFASGLWLSIAGFFDAADWGQQEGLNFAIPLPLLLGAAAFALDRWPARPNRDSRLWGEPIWLVAAIDAAVVTALPIIWAIDGDVRLLATLSWSSVLFGIAALVAARSTNRLLLRTGFGVWMAIAIGALALELPLIDEDRLPVAAVLAAIVAVVSPRLLRSLGDEDAPAELPVLGVALLGMLFLMLLVTAAYVLDPSGAGHPGPRWTWLGYLAVFGAISAGAALTGYRRGQLPPGRDRAPGAYDPWLPGVSLLFGGATIALLVRMVTTDALTWTWAGMGTAAVLYAVSAALKRTSSTNPFLQRSSVLCEYAGVVPGAVAVLANLAIAFDSSRDVNDWAQAAIYAGLGVAAMWLSIALPRTILTYAAFGAFTLAVIFAARALSDDATTILTSLIVFAWFVAGTSLVLPRSDRWSIHRSAWTTSALGIGGLSVTLAFYENDAANVDSRAWQMLVISLVSLAGLLAVDAVLRRDRIRGVTASGIAMLALLLQIAVDHPANIQAYTIPLGVYLLALGYVQRRFPVTRDILLGMGSAALLVPALLLALVNENFNDLLLAGGEALILFFGGLALRLRVPVAAGVAGITLIVLRMMVETVTALPSWITLLAVGLVLLGSGTVMLIWKEAFRNRLDRLQRGWHEMG